MIKRVGLALLCLAVFVLAACQQGSPTGPSMTNDLAKPVLGSSGAAHSYDDDDDDDDDDEARIEGIVSTLTGTCPVISFSASNTSVRTTSTTEFDDGCTAVQDGRRVEVRGMRQSDGSIVATRTRLDDDDDAQSLTARLSASPAAIQNGQSSTLTWTTTSATRVTLDGTPVALNGSQVLSPSATTTYTLVATNWGGSVTARATVTVSATAPPPVSMPTATLTATPATIDSGQSATLTWTSTDSTTVTLNGATVAASGSQLVSPPATTAYTLQATNTAGATTANATVTVTAPPPPPVPMPTATLTATPATIQSGQSTTLAWSSTDATTVTLNGATVGASGSQVVSPTATTTYTVQATNAAGARTVSATVTVTPPPVPMPTATLTVTPATIESGQSAMLSWTSTDATTVTLDGVFVPVTGSQMVSPTATKTYTLQVSNASGARTASATVTVTAPPPPPIVRLTYAHDVQPILQTNCVMCHSGPSPSSGVDLTTYANVMNEVIPGSADSLLLRVTQPGGKMHGFLSPDPLGRAETIRRWVVDFAAAEQ